MSWNESAWFSILIGTALKSTVVLGAAWLVAILLRRRSAAARHLVWTAATAAMLALPFLALSLPALRLPVSSAILPVNTGLVFRAFGVGTAEAPSQPAIAPGIEGRPVKRASWRPGVRLWLLGAWALGATVAFLKMLVAYAALWRTRRSARPFDDAGLAASLAHALEIPHGVAVLETASGTMPMTFGFLRPSVFMPADSSAWSQERRRMVLLHELAHVRRGDAATHLMARTALSLNWWNPLAWIAWREFLKERERAADDLVLSAGERASEYAGHLLEVARSLQTAPLAGCAAVAMARRSQLEGRLLAILDSRVNRTPIRGTAPILAALLAAVLVAPFAAVRAQDQPAQTTAPEIDATIRAANSQKNHEILEHAAAAYAKLRKYEVAQTLLESALTIRGQVSGQQSAAYAVGLVKLGDLAAKRNQPGEAFDFYTKAVSLGDRPEVASALVYLGMRAYGKRDFALATGLLQRALNAAPAGPQAGPALTWMAAVLDASAGGGNNPGPSVLLLGDSAWTPFAPKYNPATAAEVESLFQRALATEAPDSVDAAVTHELYARFLRQQKREAEAPPMEARAAEIRRHKLVMDPSGIGGPAGIPSVYRVGGGVSAPVVVSKRDPEYTEVARAAKYQGTVLLSIDVGPDGMAHNIRIARSLGLGLDEKAIEAVSNWQFKPGMKDGQPVTVAATIEVNFRLL